MSNLSRLFAPSVAALVLAAMPALAAPTEETGPIHFAAALSPDEQSAPTYSDATGHGDFVLDRATLTLSWTITFKDLSTPITAAHIHGPQRPGTNAGILIDVGDKGLKSPLKDSFVLNEGLLEYLLAGRLYVNIHTTKYKDGELRGQLERQLPPVTN